MKSIFRNLFVSFIILALFSCGGKDLKKKKLAEAHYKMGLSFFSEGDPTAALKEFMGAYENAPDDYEINHMLGIAYLKKKDYVNAEKHLLKATTLKDNASKAYNSLGVVYLESHRYIDAIEQFKKAVDNILYDTPEYSYANMGWAYYKKGEFIEAKKAYEKSIEVEPRFGLAYFNLGLLYFDLEKYDEAVK